MPIATSYLTAARAEFTHNRSVIRNILETLPEADLHDNRGASNSIAILVQHLYRAQVRRWTDILGSRSGSEVPPQIADFQKDWKEDQALDRAELLSLSDAGWDLVLGALDGLSDADLDRPVPLRGSEVPLLQAIINHWAHYSYHVGQLVLLAKIATRGKWTVAAAKEKVKPEPAKTVAVPA